MGYKINYEDNIFFINSIIKNLQKGMNLEIDPDYFREKILEDLFFTDSSLARLFASLRDSRFLISRHQYLRDLQRSVALFVDLINGVLDETYAFSPQLRSAAVKLKACRIEQQKNSDEIRSLLNSSPPADEHEDTVSQDEFRFLLTTDQSGEE